MSFFSSKPKLSNKEQIREWTNNLKKESRGLERERLKIEREQNKLKLELKKAAKAGQTKASRTLAKSIIQSQKSADKLLLAGTQINSVILNLKTNAAAVNVAQTMQKSTVVMQGMSKLMKIPEIRGIAQAMSKEMMKAGLVEEMIDDSMAVLDDTDIETQADEEVDKVIEQIVSGQLAGADKLKERKEQEQVEEDTSVEDEMKARLAKLES